jgi:hypothetical protein
MEIVPMASTRDARSLVVASMATAQVNGPHQIQVIRPVRPAR